MAPDPYKYFRIEARELVEGLGKALLDLEKGQAPAEQLELLLRLAHTLKGAARVVKVREIADNAHAIEDVLAPLREGSLQDAELVRVAIERALPLVDAIAGRVAQLAAVAEAASTAAIGTAVHAPAAALEHNARTLRADRDETDALIDSVIETQAQLACLRRSFVAIEGLRDRVALLAQHARPRAQRKASAQDGQVAALAEQLEVALDGIADGFERGADQVERELRQVRASAERLRLLPVELMFTLLERTARDAAQSLGKSVRFESRGGELRLDAHVLGLVQQALVQLVRNAVAHGIESESERRSAGKPAQGVVVIEAKRRAHRVSFTCRDDGRGVDVEALRRAASDKGLLTAGANLLDAAELMRVLLHGGISTSSTVTEVSGRGVGMGVVRDAVSRLGGEALLREAGQGTLFELIVPVSLTALDALIVQAGQHAAVIPLDAVRRTLRLSASDISSSSEGDSIVFEGNVIPFAPLARSLRADVANARVPGRRRLEAGSSVLSAVVLESCGFVAALGVDRLVGTDNVLVRPLSAWTPVDPVVAGASLDASGTPQLVLDPDALVGAARDARPARTERAKAARSVLVVDDSLTTRMLEQSILESAGYDVDVATSGEEGLAMARRRRYALMLVDVEMPGIDGFEVIAQLRADPELRDLPAILVTSRNAPEDLKRGQEVGAHGHIVKSEFDQADFLKRIDTLTSTR